MRELAAIRRKRSLPLALAVLRRLKLRENATRINIVQGVEVTETASLGLGR